VTDGALTIERTATFEVVRQPFDGSGRDDAVIGTIHADAVDAMAGDDVVDARTGDDVVSAGDGADQIVAGDGDDLVFAGAGEDIVLGGGGDDRIIGGQGNDRLYGDDGDDVVTGNAGHDAISGGAGADVLGGGAGDDHLSGGDGDDRLVGGTGNDRLDGGAGDDLLSDGPGQDDVQGGSGADRVVAALDGAADRLDGGDGLDTLDYSRATEAVTVDLVAGSASGAEIGAHSIASFENVVGGSGDDHFVCDVAVPTSLTGGNGDDTFEFPPAPEPPAGEPAWHAVVDFAVGDRLRMSKYDLFEQRPDQDEDRFGLVYGDDPDRDDMPIRYRHDRTDELSRTVVEADFDNDDVWEITIALEGHRILVVSEHA
jgi:Ca2+-binding RTX toxin-like protein